MTQAFNLSQLANNLDSSGRLDATDGLVNAVPVANGGTGASSAAAARTNLGVAAAVYAVPAGGIIMWSGTVAAIPSGWFLCDGANGTPNLRDRFVIGAGSSYAVGASGGSKDAIVVSHSHTGSTATAGSHTHPVSGGSGGAVQIMGVQSGIVAAIAAGGTPSSYYTQFNGADILQANGNHTHGVTVDAAGSSGTNANLPPYYALCFIMKS
jgi:hypothetical protein